MAFSPTPSAALRYWNMARQRYCRRLARSCNTLRVSADPIAKPAAHSRAESRGSRPSKAAPGERRTLRWRGESTANSSLKLGADSGRVMDDSGIVKRIRVCAPVTGAQARLKERV